MTSKAKTAGFEAANPWENPRSYLPDCFDQLASVHHYEKLARQARRKVKAQRLVRALCIAVAVFAVVYFVLRLAVGAVS